jgi:hypothetical protein
VSLSRRDHVLTLGLVAVLTFITLALTASGQFYDANYYATSEATALLAGDHPYRDFFEVGIPLDAYLSAGTLWAAGNRLIGEFARQWLFLVAGAVLSFHLTVRRARSAAPAIAALPVMLLVLTATPIYHFSKLFFFPLAILLGSRYIERPGPLRGAALALTTALAFLVRHDYGVYLGGGSIVAFAIARAAVPASRASRSMLRDAGAYAAVIIAVLAPWLVAVQANEGLVAYTRVRTELLQGPRESVYLALLHVNPFREFSPDPLPAGRPGRVAFSWNPEVAPATRRRLEGEFGLRAIDGASGPSRQYELPNIYDAGLLRLITLVHDTEGIPWEQLQHSQSRLPGRERAMEWLHQMTLLLPLALLVSAGADWWRGRSSSGVAPPHVAPQIFAAIFLAGVCSATLRERSYLMTLAPTTAALAAGLLTGPGWLRRGATAALLALSTVAGVSLAQGSALFTTPGVLADSTRDSFARLVRLPPEYDYAPFEYIRDCSLAGDRVLISGLTPLHVSYYTGRRMAGGQINWHRGWRSDPAGQQEALALLQRQSVPFAISTSDPLLTEFRLYPRVRDILAERYAVLDGSGGTLMADRGRTAVRPWGPHGWPCFR